MKNIWKTSIVILGAGDRGTAIALRLFRSGFSPILMELEKPTDLHYPRTFSDAVYRGEKIIDNIVCELIPDSVNDNNLLTNIIEIQNNRKVPVVTGNSGKLLDKVKPDVLIDCRGNFRDSDDFIWSDFPYYVSTNDACKVGKDAHCVIGSHGLEIKPGMTEHVTGRPSAKENIINSPIEGVFISASQIGQNINEGQEAGEINGIAIQSPVHGILSGLLHSGHFVFPRQPLFEVISERKFNSDVKMVPPENYMIAGGILEVVLGHLSSSGEYGV